MRGELFAGEPRDECCAPAKGSSLSALRDEAPNVWRQDISHNARFMLRTTPRTKQSVTKSTRFLKKKKGKKTAAALQHSGGSGRVQTFISSSPPEIM